ncbi:MAG: hypothetical protein J6W86_08065 [Bacteroidales bacterium]|nr:hypothetical protein [Bacteroidales bacterium]
MENTDFVVIIIEVVALLALFFSYKSKKRSYKNRCSKCGRDDAMRDFDKEIVGYYHTNLNNYRAKTHIDNVYKRYRRCKYCGHEDARVYVGYDILQRLH